MPQVCPCPCAILSHSLVIIQMEKSDPEPHSQLGSLLVETLIVKGTGDKAGDKASKSFCQMPAELVVLLRITEAEQLHPTPHQHGEHSPVPHYSHVIFSQSRPSQGPWCGSHSLPKTACLDISPQVVS